MTENSRKIEFADKTVERAIEQACEHFGVDDKDKLEITLITRGSTGLFGLGGRKARIKARLRPVSAPESEGREQDAEAASRVASAGTLPSERDQETEASVKESAEEQGLRETDRDGEKAAAQEEEPPVEDQSEEDGPAAASPGRDGDSASPDQAEIGESDAGGSAPQELSDEMLERLERARVYTTELLEKAGLDGMVQVNADPANPCIDISGEDISIIIGKDGNTLDAIEYLVNLKLKRTDETPGRRISLDAQGYRAKRDENLKRTAEKLAMKARKTRRSVAMSPMNSRERRIVHMAVKAIHGVRTHSTGDGRLRKVIITPVRRGENRRQGGRRQSRR